MSVSRLKIVLRSRPAIWMALGLLTLVVKGVFTIWPAAAELAYSRGIYQAFRWGWDFTLAMLPFPLLWLILLGLPSYWAWRWRKKRSGHPLRASLPNAWARAGVNVLGFLGFASFTFQWMWAFNYQRVTVEETLHLQMPALNEEEILEEYAFATAQVVASRAQVGDTTLALSEAWQPSADLQLEVRQSLSQVLARHGYPTPGKVRLKHVSPPGTLMYFGANGIYLPWAGESYAPADLPICHLPFLMAHELSHGHGFADEGTANFWAHTACRASDEPAIRYSADLHYWKYVAREVWKVDTLAFHAGRNQLPSGVKKDLRQEREHGEKYQTWFSGISFTLYNGYLKSQGVQDGYMSYSRIVRMVRAYRKAGLARP